MAIGIHVVRVAFLAVSDKTGQVVTKTKTTTINETLHTHHQHLVIPDADVPNSAGYPTVDAYLKLEAATNYVLKHMDQNMIVTYYQAA